MTKFAEFFASQLGIPLSSANTPSTSSPSSNRDFTPPTDIFNTAEAYILHIALPGAQKSDIGVHWDPESNELCVAGVVHRPGDEDFLKMLERGERQVGAFERKVKLGGKGVQVDPEGIEAKMEDGVLVVTVPKLEKEGFVEVRRVDVE